MKKVSISKRLLSAVLAVLVVVSCVLTAYAGSVAPFAGDSTTAGKSKVALASGGCTIAYDLGGRAKTTTSGITMTMPVGTVCKATAEDTATRFFMYWLDQCSDRVYSYDRSIEFVLGARVNLKAVCSTRKSTETEKTHFVSYLNYGGTTLNANSKIMFNCGEDVAVPTDVKVPGLTFTGWSKTPAEIKATEEDVIVLPTYTVDAQDYTVNITNEDYVSGAGTYTTFQTVTVKADEKNGEGKAFSYWKNEKDEVVSYERDYSFRINYNTTLTAVFGETVTPEPVIRFSTIYRDQADLKMTFYAERSVPTTYKVLNHGILMCADSTITEENMVLAKASDVAGANDVRRVNGNTNENCGTFSLAKAKVGRNTPITARAYMVCEEIATGNSVIVYTDVVRTTNAG